MNEGQEIRRFIMLNLEPFLSFLSSDKYIKYGSYRKLKKALKKQILSNYKGENEDYMEFVFEKNFADFESSISIKAHKNFYKAYTLLAKYSFNHISNNLLSGMRINNYELYKFTGLYIEPLQILFSYLISKGIHFDPKTFKETDFYNMDILRNKKIGDLHIHAETSYLFRNLIEYLLRNYKEIESSTDIIRQGLNLLSDLNFIILIYKKLIYNLSDKETRILYKLIYSSTYLIIPKTPIFKRFNYRTLINGCLSNIIHRTEVKETLFFVIGLQKLNRIMSSLTFKGEYKGLKHMRKFFNSEMKKLFQQSRDVLDKNEILVEPLQKDNYVSYAELRISPEPKQIEFWESLFKDNKAGNPKIKLIIHHKKFKNINELYDFYYIKPKTSIHEGNDAFLKLIDEVENMFRFLLKNPDKANLIVGFDAASIEYWTPPWVFRDIFKFWKIFFKLYFHRNIGITFHAGEDFVDSATGLRYIYEAIKFLNANRIGHGLTLLIDFDKYHMRYSMFRFDLLHYFLHILWLHHLCFSYPEYFSRFKHYVEEALYDFIESVNVEISADSTHKFIQKFIEKHLRNQYFLNKFYENLGFSEYLERIATARKCRFSHLILSAIGENYKDRNYARNTFKFMKQLVKFVIVSNNKRKRTYTAAPLLPQDTMDYEMQILFIKEISKFITYLANDRGVSFEICPSSNIVLYNIRSFRDHPVLSKNNNNVKFSVNTDNPLLLNTNLILEHLLLHEATNGRTYDNNWDSFKFA